MAYFHCRTRIQIRTQTQIPNPMATQYYAEHVSTARIQTQIQIWIPFPNGYCTHFRDDLILGMDLHPKDRSLSLLHSFQSGDQSLNLNQWKNPA